MTTNRRAPLGRRWFLRSTTGAALSVVAMGAQALFGAATASARESGCCFLFAQETAWCPLLCQELNQLIRCWTCNNNRCRCCECTTDSTCWRGITACSYKYGCCEEE